MLKKWKFPKLLKLKKLYRKASYHFWAFHHFTSVSLSTIGEVKNWYFIFLSCILLKLLKRSYILDIICEDTTDLKNLRVLSPIIRWASTFPLPPFLKLGHKGGPTENEAISMCDTSTRVFFRALNSNLQWVWSSPPSLSPKWSHKRGLSICWAILKCEISFLIVFGVLNSNLQWVLSSPPPLAQNEATKGGHWSYKFFWSMIHHLW